MSSFIKLFLQDKIHVRSFAFMVQKSSFFFSAPPKWIKEPQDASVGLEGRVSLDCEVRGHPVPRITWFKYLGKL